DTPSALEKLPIKRSRIRHRTVVIFTTPLLLTHAFRIEYLKKIIAKKEISYPRSVNLQFLAYLHNSSILFAFYPGQQ
ncbi:MAG: hypothetical protein ACR2KZ_10140, partial [Segetibacter sp.]